jgi:hypothetical protein
LEKKASVDLHPAEAYHTRLDGIADLAASASRVFAQAFRTSLDAPGFALLAFEQPVGSHELRQAMLDLKLALATLFHDATGKHLVYQSMARFDQQTTTKFHLDGGPATSFLMLGYEATPVASVLSMADYTLAAQRLGITPAAFIDQHNPMYLTGEKMLAGTITQLSAFDAAKDQILVVNNSCLPPGGTNQLGVLHQATIPQPDPRQRRVINSTMLFAANSPDDETMSPRQQAEYIATDRVSGTRGY